MMLRLSLKGAAAFGLSLLLVGVPPLLAQEEELPKAKIEFTVQPLKAPAAEDEVIEYCPGEPILLQYTLTNVGEELVKVVKPIHWFSMRWSIVSSGDLRAIMEMGGDPIGFDGAMRVAEEMVMRLGPGETFSDYLDLTLRYLFPPNGEFEVQGRYWTGERPDPPRYPALGVAFGRFQARPFRIRINPVGWSGEYLELEYAKHCARTGQRSLNEIMSILDKLLHCDIVQEWAYYYKASIPDLATSKDTPEVKQAYQEFLRRYPDSSCTPVARARLEAMEKAVVPDKEALKDEKGNVP
jgi:hypothetical protein